ncbi:zinc-binding alcohol dehydrogenase family protein [Kineosporia rhizophila]|uniref:zinc-binding alcohol dehydrogenase family protein n=1 Tax=Kineosporia TaxID=49184 RepID=UPI001E48ADC9|nr:MULTISPECIES: zinc-binding alcohol dehydrogenase family protein [Kineosporia]MCE0536238.1 zinc-binding alcohol dehydrogenase family protein [Kineosporia rhizophila]GLY15174.1 NADPH:quinone reductase [Kineosporia sp. NBRC 101677]
MGIRSWQAVGGTDKSFTEVEREVPELRPRDVLVRVKAVSVNPVDTKVHAGLAPGRTRQLGWDAAGVVEAVGSQAQSFRVGDEVFYAGDISRDGTNAELHAVDERIVGRRPSTLSWEESAALPLTAITAWETMFDQLKMTPEDKGHFLVLGAAGGVGSILTQLVKTLTPGVEVIAAAGRGESRDWARQMGADHVIGRDNLVEDVRAFVPEGVGRVFSPYTRGNIPTYAELVRTFGQVVAIDEPEGQDSLPLKAKAASLHWELMFARVLNQASDLAEQGRLLTQVAELADAGRIRSTLTQSFDGPAEAALQRAHAVVASGGAIGKVAVRLPE